MVPPVKVVAELRLVPPKLLMATSPERMNVPVPFQSGHGRCWQLRPVPAGRVADDPAGDVQRAGPAELMLPRRSRSVM